ncbi:MAG: CinA family protein [Oscillospiraceae bacterium]|nr:CinA family protein [Oscillospiraceae bacterium]
MKIEEKLVKLLIKKNLTIACAESCTAGLLSASIVNAPSASKILNYSAVTYSNEAKKQHLNISENDIANYGVVSEEIASQMAKNIAQKAGSDIGISVTGNAGPEQGDCSKPVGTVCFGFYILGKVYSVTELFLNMPRNDVRLSSVYFCINKLIELLDNVR